MAVSTVVERQQPVPITMEQKQAAPARVRGSSIGAREAESHIPTLKNQGKSDWLLGLANLNGVDINRDFPDLDMVAFRNGDREDFR